MESLITGEIGLFAIFLVAVIFICGIGVPVIGFFLAKDLVLNLASWVIIKVNTNFQFQNHFEMESRNCQIIEIMWTKVIVVDVDTGEYTKISTSEFLKERVWMRSAKRREWSEDERKKIQVQSDIRK